MSARSSNSNRWLVRPIAHVALALSLAVFAAAPVAQAGQGAGGPITVRDGTTVGHGADMVVLGSAGGDRVNVTVRDHQWVISSPSGFSTSDCTYELPTTVECPHYSPYINLLGQGGDDRLKFKARGDQIHGRIDGGQGADTLRGSDARNILQGGPGHDVIKGGRGNDEIYGDQGIDAVFGQRGNDLIYAQNHQRAERLDCGRGHNDTIYVDHADPKPTRCEHVRFGSPY